MLKWDDWSDKGRIYDMWQRNFRDPVPYADFYFSEVYGHNDIVLRCMDPAEKKEFKDWLEEEYGDAPDQEILMGMIHLNPYTLVLSGKDLPAHYIVGVATDEEYRRRGVMRDMLYKSFSHLKEKGECLTYLMPADPDYYLPFDFRFGRPQIEQEYYMDGEPEVPGWEFRKDLSDEEREACARLENEWKIGVDDLFTRITGDYLLRLEKETKADFGQMFYVFDQGRYLGRFCAAVEYECLILSRIFGGGDPDCRTRFIKNVMTFARKTFHYGNHQMILDISWEELLEDGLKLTGVRAVPGKNKSRIMFRILDLEGLAPYLKSCRDASFSLDVQDEFFPENGGLYRVECREGQVTMTKTESSADQDEPDFQVGISDLTSWIFGGSTDEESGMDPAAADKLTAIRPVCTSCIMEIV